MLLDLEYAADGSGRGTPIFFPARLERGILLHRETSRSRSLDGGR